MKTVRPTMPTILLLLAILGCNNRDERLVELSREHAARQAETQRQMADLQKQVAEGSRQLVASDAKAREELTGLQRDLRSDQAEIHHGRDQLEAERREIAAQRYRDPIVAAILTDIGIVLACMLPSGAVRLRAVVGLPSRRVRQCRGGTPGAGNGRLGASAPALRSILRPQARRLAR